MQDEWGGFKYVVILKHCYWSKTKKIILKFHESKINTQAQCFFRPRPKRSHHGSTGPGSEARPFWPYQNNFQNNNNNPAYHPGPVLPPGGDGSPL